MNKRTHAYSDNGFILPYDRIWNGKSGMAQDLSRCSYCGKKLAGHEVRVTQCPCGCRGNIVVCESCFEKHLKNK